MKGFTNRFTRRANKVAATQLPPEPRAMADIEKEYAELLGKSAQAAYQVYVYQKQHDKLNERLEQVNNEAANRQALDKAAKTTEEVQDEQGK